MPLVNCEINFFFCLAWQMYILTRKYGNQEPKFAITNTKPYTVVTLSAQDNEKLLEKLKSGLKITVNWNKC